MSITVSEYKRFLPEINKGALLGSCTVLVNDWLEVRDVKIFQKDGRRFIGMPSRQYEKDGKKAYYAYVRIPNRDTSDAFTTQVITALDAYLAAQSPTPNDPIPQTNDCPF